VLVIIVNLSTSFVMNLPSGDHAIVEVEFIRQIVNSNLFIRRIVPNCWDK
jgi:hypothetical protein